MPYGKVVFETPSAASAALEDLRETPRKVGNGELPIEVEPLQLRQGTRHWKWGRGRARPHERMPNDWRDRDLKNLIR